MKDKAKTPTDNIDYEKPVAYDVHGKPLYAHPSIDNATRTIHVARSVEPQKVEVSDAIKLKHEKSCKLFPYLNLSESEYVISAVRRHPIGMFLPIAVGVFLLFIVLAFLVNIGSISAIVGPELGGVLSSGLVLVCLLGFMGAVIAGVLISIYVYRRNRFFLTNESVIQEIQTGLFYKHEQTVSLLNIEDASFYKSGLLQQIFDFGTIRLSTEGDETTYLFSYVAKPKEEISTLNNAVEAFKNGRPLEY